MPSDLLRKAKEVHGALVELECLLAKADVRQRERLAIAIKDVTDVALRLASHHCGCRKSKVMPTCSLTGIPLDPV